MSNRRKGLIRKNRHFNRCKNEEIIKNMQKSEHISSDREDGSTVGLKMEEKADKENPDKNKKKPWKTAAFHGFL